MMYDVSSYYKELLVINSLYHAPASERPYEIALATPCAYVPGVLTPRILVSPLSTCTTLHPTPPSCYAFLYRYAIAVVYTCI